MVAVRRAEVAAQVREATELGAAAARRRRVGRPRERMRVEGRLEHLLGLRVRVRVRVRARVRVRVRG